ncbi:MAG: MoaD/ThiS family protein [Gammaproteobacteria bacterium]|nr:MoaD/ThiS family protein [Gammaproteobacteria bacterium]
MISVKYFAGLREYMGRTEEHVEAAHARSVAEVWAGVARGAPWPANMLAAVNHTYADAQQQVFDGDEVAFFPPVTGG